MLVKWGHNHAISVGCKRNAQTLSKFRDGQCIVSAAYFVDSDFNCVYWSILHMYIYIYMYYIVDQYFHYSSCIILYALIGGENYMSLFTGSAFTSQGPPRVKSSIIPLVIYGDLMDFNGDLWWFLTHRTERDWKMVCSRRASETGKLAHGEANVWVCGMFIYTL